MGADALIGAHAQDAQRALGKCGQVRVCRGKSRNDGLGVPQQQRAGLSELEVRLAARALDEPHADDRLERRNLLADGGLRVAKSLCRVAERAELGDGVQGQQVTQLESGPNSRQADESHHKDSLD